MFCLSLITQMTRKTVRCHQVNKLVKLGIKRNQHIQTRIPAQIVSSIPTNYNVRRFSHASEIKAETEQEFLVQLKNDPDNFGDAQEKEPFDEMDLKEEKHLEERASPSQKLSTKQYADLIKSFISKRQIQEAINVLEVKMLKEDQVKPENYIYNLLLGACGRVGYTKKAFSLYNQMKKRGLQVTAGTYTALFNACANSPWPEDGLTRAKHLQNIMIEKMFEPNATNYNAMIKAFGRCGDLQTTFNLVDEMLSKKLQIKDDTINFLLQACIQDKEAGFRHALLVWRRLIKKNIPPTLYTYNLMLRCIRDCGIGDFQVMTDTFNNILQREKVQLEDTTNKLLLEKFTDCELIQKDMKSDFTTKIRENQTELISDGNFSKVDMCRPNLMAKRAHLGNIVALSEITKAEDRLLIVGGFNGFLDNMLEHNCRPDIKTFTQLLDCIPRSIAAEQELQKVMQKYGVKPDIDFFNMLIKKRSMRFDYINAEKVLEEMKKFNYRPNLITYGVLALGCKTKEHGLRLLGEMKDHSYRLNTEILGAMLHQACYHNSFSYVLEMMEISLKEDVKPNQKFMQCLQDFKKKCKDISNDKENNLSHKVSFQKGFTLFKLRYKSWLTEVEVDGTDNVHPWSQYRTTSETDTRHYKDKASRFEPIHASKFKVKTSKKRK